MLSTLFNSEQYHVSHLHLLKLGTLASSRGSITANPINPHNLLTQSDTKSLYSGPVHQPPSEHQQRQHDSLNNLDNFDIQSLPSLMSSNPSIRDLSESLDGRDDEDEDEEMDEYDIFAAPGQQRNSTQPTCLSNGPVTPMQLLNGPVLESTYAVSLAHPQPHSQQQDQPYYYGVTAPGVGFGTMYPHFQFQQSACQFYTPHEQFLSLETQLQLQSQHTLYPTYSSQSDLPTQSTLNPSSHGPHNFAIYTHHYGNPDSVDHLTSLEGQHQQILHTLSSPPTAVSSSEKSMRLPLNSQFADTLINNESLPLLMSSASTLIQSPSISWTSITPSRDSSPDMPAEPEPESLTATTGRRPMNRFLKKRSGSTYSRPGSKVPRTKSMAPFVPFSHSVSSIPTGDPMLAPYGTVDDNNMQCQDLVSSAFGTLIKRRRRVRQVKTKVKLTSFACDSPGCGKVFSRAYNLTSHMKTHSAERPFLCDSCPLAFARRHDRERHVRLHTGEKPYSCESCGCGFMRNDALHRHQRICGQSAAALMALLQQQQKQYQSDVKLETATAGEEIH